MARQSRRSPGDRCPIDRAMQAIGTRSAILLMREALYDTFRFDDFVVRTGLTEAVVASRLRHLVDAGLLERQSYRDPGQRTRHGYVLTESGRDLMPAVLALGQWGAKYADGTRARTFEHAGCGGAVHVVVECAEHHQVGVDEVIVS
ncbi:HxlR family transcriptional regulator [Rudaeicoccus suwonensis]|uniref:HxlR family transcriptional regulator n=2 Tax=Rudaeicoccus suwonensis TaxID=657409 RepID=A0A561E859_9MICO|nr:HxlR family transcriptional regulator [Rudaeicoccus suwonensis]